MQPDWNQTDDSKYDFIKNKPDVEGGGGGDGVSYAIKTPSGKWLHGWASAFAINQTPANGYTPMKNRSKTNL